MAFRFSLASVLRVRESIEKREEVALLSIQLEVARVRRRIDELTNEMAKAWQDREEALRRTIPANRLQTMQAEMNAAAEARQVLVDSLKTLKRQRDAQMKVYRSAHMGRQMITDLYKQQKSAYEQEQLRIEQKAIDSVFAARWQRS